MRMLFGADVFIAYARKDGREYAEALARVLVRDRKLSCALDLRYSLRGVAIPPEVHVAMMRSSMMLVVATRGATESKHVASEIYDFGQLNRPMIFIVLDVPSPKDIWTSLDDANIVCEHATGELPKAPSSGTLDAVFEKIDFTKQSQRLRRFSAGAGALLTASLLAVGAASYKLEEANTRVEDATSQTRVSRSRGPPLMRRRVVG